MSDAELKATMDTGLARGGRDGLTYVTNDVYFSADSAQRHCLPIAPQVLVIMGVPSGTFSPPNAVLPDYGQPGGGTERTGAGKIPVKVLDTVRLKPGG